MTFYKSLSVSPLSPTAAPSPSSLGLQLSASPRADVWHRSQRRCLSASGSASRLSTTCSVEGNKSDAQKRKKAKSKDEFDFSPSGFMIELVFQLPDFLLNDAQLLSVNKHCVLLKSTQTLF